MSKYKTIYFRNILKDMINHKFVILIICLLCTLGFGALGVKKVHSAKVIDKIENEEYLTALENYDKSYEDVQESLKLVNKQINDLQEYIDNSAYMKIDGNNIQTSTAQFSILNAGNAGNVLNAFILYINEGELKNQICEKFPELDVKYWKDIVTCNSAGNNLNVTVIHYDMNKANSIKVYIIEKIEEYSESLKTKQGDFEIIIIGNSNYIKSDVNVVNIQNTNINNLKNYINSRADMESKLSSIISGKKNYIDKNKPEDIGIYENPIKTLIKFVIVGIISGIAIPFALFLFIYMLDDRLRSVNDLKQMNLDVLKETSSGDDCSDIALLAKKLTVEKLCVDSLSASDNATSICVNIAKSMEGCNLKLFKEDEQYTQISSLIDSSHAILLVEPGVTTYGMIENEIKKCRQYKVELIGAVVVK